MVVEKVLLVIDKVELQEEIGSLGLDTIATDLNLVVKSQHLGSCFISKVLG